MNCSTSPVSVFIEFSSAEIEFPFGAHLHRVFDALKVHADSKVEQRRARQPAGKRRAESLAMLVCRNERLTSTLAEPHRERWRVVGRDCLMVTLALRVGAGHFALSPYGGTSWISSEWQSSQSSHLSRVPSPHLKHMRSEFNSNQPLQS